MAATRTVRTWGAIIRAVIVVGAVVLIATSGVSIPLGTALIAVLVAALFVPWSRLRRRTLTDTLERPRRSGTDAERRIDVDEDDHLAAARLRAALGLDGPDRPDPAERTHR